MKRMTLIATLTVLVLMAAPGWSFALDLKECLDRGMANSDRVKAALAGWDQARMQRYASPLNFLPTLSAQGSKTWLDVHSTMPETSVSLPAGLPAEQAQLLGAIFGAMDFSSLTAVPDHNDDLTLSAYQPLTQLPQIAFYDKVASDSTELAHLSYEVTKDQTVLYLASQYFGVLLARDRTRALQRALEQVERLKHDAENMMQQGMITKADLLKFQMRYSEVEMQLLQARNDEAVAKSHLALLLDLPIEKIECAETEIAPSALKEMSWYQETGQKDRRELRMVGLQEGIAGATRNAAYLSLLPQVGAIASANWNEDGLDTTPDRTYAAGFALSWNFWGWGGDVLKARAAGYAREKAIFEANATRIDLRVSIEKAWRDATVARQVVKTYRETLDQAEENFRIENNRYQIGKSTAADLLGAQTQLTAADTGYKAALYNVALADANLEASIGHRPFSQLTGESDHE
ncbi:MAG: TolC family protein [Myxococcales bacterium]|nr:TolC family protein [Myxococcales bacterium]